MTARDTSSAYGHLKLRHLRLLSLLESEGSITRAASALHLTQPAASAMLRELESLFGMQLVERSPQGVQLTPGARAALRRFDIALAEVDAARAEARLAHDRTLQRLRVGALTLAMRDLIPTALRTFLDDRKRLRLDIVEGTMDGLTRALMRGELDCVVGHIGPAWADAPTDSMLAQARLFDETRCVLARAGHELALGPQQPVPLPTLAAAQWVLPPRTSSSRVALDDAFVQRGTPPPSPTVESESILSNLELVAATDLLTIAPRTMARGYLADGALVELNSPLEVAGIPLSVIWRRTSENDRVLERFRDAMVLASLGRPRREGLRLFDTAFPDSSLHDLL